ncbi:MAG: SDR family NAD(P)-dependent oxidoreductase [Lachnospiraceae bacterium]|nr:SDR family NAD(P)-dependent oxidoreductase [Lachnospiraceae bacterium]
MKHVLITGADRGVGFALAEVFSKNGYIVYAGQFMPDWPELENLKERFPETLHIIPLDVGNDVSVKEAVKLVSAKTDCLDILINCAGIFYQEDNRERFLHTVQVNTFGSLRTIEAFYPLMQKGQKRICNFSSEAGVIALSTRPDTFTYTSSKAALNMASQMLFQKLRPEGFTFRLYHPGWVRSYMSGVKATEGHFEPEETALVAFKQFTGDIPCEDVLMIQDVYNRFWPF